MEKNSQWLTNRLRLSCFMHLYDGVCFRMGHDMKANQNHHVHEVQRIKWVILQLGQEAIKSKHGRANNLTDLITENMHVNDLRRSITVFPASQDSHDLSGFHH